MIRFLAAAAILLCMTLGASADNRCKVTDPTGTPLNVREAPNGKITGTVKNGALVTILKTEEQNGKPWVFVADYETKKEIGWVFREFVSCF
jgi:hypothetical protein